MAGKFSGWLHRLVVSIATALAQVVGLVPERQPIELTMRLQVPVQNAPGQKASAQLAMLSVIQTIPLYAPLFPEVRLAILQCLDKLHQVGPLERVAGNHESCQYPAGN
jgi:hypothetical protein